MDHRELLNAFLALRLKQPGWPPVLANCSYVISGVGVTLKLAGGDKAAPDVVASATERHHTLITEVKGGHSVDISQLTRMEGISAQNLRDYHHLSIPKPEVHRISVVYFCNEEEREGLANEVGERATVIGFNGSRFRLSGRTLADDMLRQELMAAKVEVGLPPLAIIPFDQDTALGDVARVAMPVAVGQLLHGTGTITPEGILRTTHGLVFDVMTSTGSDSELKQIRSRVLDFLREAAGNELKGWLAREEGQPTWRFRRSLSSDQAARTRDLQALQKLGYELVERLGGLRGVQLELDDISRA